MKRECQQAARDLRQQGLSLGKIARKLGVSKSSVSLWVRDIILSDEVRAHLAKQGGLSRRGKKGKYGFSTKRREMGEESWAEHEKSSLQKRNNSFRLRNPEKYVNRDMENKIRLVEYKGGCCQRCGYDKCIGALEFHHRDPSEKEFEIGSYHASYEKARKEADKCDLVCRNCHIEIHWPEFIKRREDRIARLKLEAVTLYPNG